MYGVYIIPTLGSCKLYTIVSRLALFLSPRESAIVPRYPSGVTIRRIIRTIAEGVLAIKCSVPLHYLCTPGKVTSLIVIMLSAVAGATGKGVLRAVLTTKRNKDPC